MAPILNLPPSPARGLQGGLFYGGPSSLSCRTHRQASQSICVLVLAPHLGAQRAWSGLHVLQPWPAHGGGCLGLVFPVLAAPGQVAGLESHASGAHTELVLLPAVWKPWGCGRCRLSKHHSPQHSTCRGSDFPCLAGHSGDPRRGGTEERRRDLGHKVGEERRCCWDTCRDPHGFIAAVWWGPGVNSRPQY